MFILDFFSDICYNNISLIIHEVIQVKKIIRALALLIAAAIISGCTDLPDSSRTDSSRPDIVPVFSDNSDSLDSNSVPENSDIPEIPEKTEPEYVSWMLEEKVHEIRIEMTAENWNKLKANPYSKTYFPANVSIDGEVFENVGIKTRGNASLYEAVEKQNLRFPFKIKFDKYVDGGNFLGLDELALNNGGDDYSLMRDYLGYEAFRMLDGYASCVTFFNVYLNDELRGFYVGVEAIDSSYLERYFNSHKHNLYEGENNATLLPSMSLKCFTQKKGSDTSMTDISLLIKAISEAPLGEKGDIEKYLDVDSALKMLAINAVVDNRDGYGGLFAHNYYFYSVDGKLVMIPWDMNAPSMSAYTDIASPTIGVYNNSHMNSRPLAKKLMAVDEYYAIYLDYCKQLADKLPELKEKVLRVYEMIKPHVENDPNKFMTTWYFNNQYSTGNPSGVVTFLSVRYTYLQKRLEELKGKPVSNSVLNP